MSGMVKASIDNYNSSIDEVIALLESIKINENKLSISEIQKSRVSVHNLNNWSRKLDRNLSDIYNNYTLELERIVNNTEIDLFVYLGYLFVLVSNISYEYFIR